MEYKIRIIAIDNVTHDVKRIVAEKPEGYTFEPGQATEVAINKEELKDEKRPFTFTSLPQDEHLELTIKMYEHEGVTKEFDKLNTNDELLIGDAWGSIKYKGDGYFIAGGAGITPFISILRKLEVEDKLAGNTLIFSNKEEKDIILEVELRQMLGLKFINTLTKENKEAYYYGRIDKDFLKDHVKDFSKYFYVCGPMKMTNQVLDDLKSLGVKEEQLVYEK